MKNGAFVEKQRVLISEKELMRRINQLAKQITKDYEGKEPILICILKGATYFFTDLTKRIKIDIKVDFIRAASYEGENSTGKIDFKLKLDKEVTGKDVIIVEDIIDTGYTLKEILNYLREQKPNTLKLCVLLNKPGRRVEHEIAPDYVGFTISNLFVIGYGLDLNERYRNIPSIKCIVRSEEEDRQIKEHRETIKHQLIL